jgi:hypothetical protein
VPDQVAQTNNALIYPALGLGAILARSRTISPSMLMAGVHALASLSPALTNPEASLLPDLADVRAVSVDVAAAVVRQAVADGNAQDEATIKIVQGKEGQSLEDYIRVSGKGDGWCPNRSKMHVHEEVQEAKTRDSRCKPMGHTADTQQSRMWDAVYRPLELVD